MTLSEAEREVLKPLVINYHQSILGGENNHDIMVMSMAEPKFSKDNMSEAIQTLERFLEPTPTEADKQSFNYIKFHITEKKDDVNKFIEDYVVSETILSHELMLLVVECILRSGNTVQKAIFRIRDVSSEISGGKFIFKKWLAYALKIMTNKRGGHVSAPLPENELRTEEMIVASIMELICGFHVIKKQKQVNTLKNKFSVDWDDIVLKTKEFAEAHDIKDVISSCEKAEEHLNSIQRDNVKTYEAATNLPSLLLTEKKPVRNAPVLDDDDDIVEVVHVKPAPKSDTINSNKIINGRKKITAQELTKLKILSKKTGNIGNAIKSEKKITAQELTKLKILPKKKTDPIKTNTNQLTSTMQNSRWNGSIGNGISEQRNHPSRAQAHELSAPQTNNGHHDSSNAPQSQQDSKKTSSWQSGSNKGSGTSSWGKSSGGDWGKSSGGWGNKNSGGGWGKSSGGGWGNKSSGGGWGNKGSGGGWGNKGSGGGWGNKSSGWGTKAVSSANTSQKPSTNWGSSNSSRDESTKSTYRMQSNSSAKKYDEPSSSKSELRSDKQASEPRESKTPSRASAPRDSSRDTQQSDNASRNGYEYNRSGAFNGKKKIDLNSSPSNGVDGLADLPGFRDWRKSSSSNFRKDNSTKQSIDVPSLNKVDLSTNDGVDGLADLPGYAPWKTAEFSSKRSFSNVSARSGGSDRSQGYHDRSKRQRVESDTTRNPPKSFGRGKDRTLPAWMAKMGSEIENRGDEGNTSNLAPHQSMGRGRGKEKTLPAWMTQNPEATAKERPLSRTVRAPDNTASLKLPSHSSAGRGRGKDKTLPAWMTKGSGQPSVESHQKQYTDRLVSSDLSSNSHVERGRGKLPSWMNRPEQAKDKSYQNQSSDLLSSSNVGRGRGKNRTLPAWMAQQGTPSDNGSSGSIQSVQSRDRERQRTAADTSRSGANPGSNKTGYNSGSSGRESGRGRGKDRTLPSWMTNSGNDGPGQPKATQSSVHSMHSGPRSQTYNQGSAGRGRGKDINLPAWMKK